MKNKYTKPEDFKIRSRNRKKCNCIIQKVITPICLEEGICPRLTIVGVLKGVRKEKQMVRKENLDMYKHQITL